MNKKAIHWGKIYVYLTKNGYINKLLQLDTKKNQSNKTCAKDLNRYCTKYDMSTISKVTEHQ